MSIAKSLDRRRALALGLGAAALAALPAQAQTALEERGYALGEMVLGSPDAPLTIVEYSSFTCPHCATFHTQTLPAIKEKYIDTGKVRLIFREAYFDQYGLWASMLARCGGDSTFFGYADVLFEKLQEWARAENIVGELQRIGRLGGLPAERIQQCLSDEEFMRVLVERYQTNAQADGLRATPSFKFGDGALVSGAMGVEAFSQMIEDNL